MRVLLTGGRGGIGSAIRDLLNSAGHSVIAPSREDLDLSDPKAVSNWIESNLDLEIDALILSAGINNPCDFNIVPDDEYLRIIQVKLNSNRLILKAFLPGMQFRKLGRIVAISSSYSSIAREGRSSYSVSKAGLEALIRSVAVENAQFNIIANSIAPGFIETPLTIKNNNPIQLEKIKQRIPLNRLGTPHEVAELTKFLLNENTYITGQSIRIDGGFSIN
jgi:NAD(P)-dependent dehydrogenase (short-subunit alcohol dehydrogenase family)